jgi:transcriptional regulator with XRE-family HTH domain
MGLDNLSDIQYNKNKEVSMMEKAIGQAIREARKKKDLTQEETSKKVGCSRTYLAEIESGKYSPGWEVLRKLAKELKINLNSLL